MYGEGGEEKDEKGRSETGGTMRVGWKGGGG